MLVSTGLVWNFFIDSHTLPQIFFFFNDTATTEIYTLSLHDALPILPPDVSGTIAIDGAPVTITTTTPGQNAQLTFSGTAGQRVNIGRAHGCTPGTGEHGMPSYA